MSSDSHEVAEHASKSIDPSLVPPPPISTDVRPIQFGWKNQHLEHKLGKKSSRFRKKDDHLDQAVLKEFPKNYPENSLKNDFDARTVHNADEDISPENGSLQHIGKAEFYLQ
ncbi:hypothetical protein DID88_008624 [Monilinia fructigena]|uniref:Uncharacterized protein n=1 Tax=Monilinia fructigena TaxID=38457 RepID=A0A395JB00_9HELO|nr:hypothetical protein DID88_008624 [Monilinia fructigena]